MPELVTSDCQHLLPKFLCRNCSATFLERASGHVSGPYTNSEKKDMQVFQDTVRKSMEPVLIEAEIQFAEIKRKVERYAAKPKVQRYISPKL